MYVYIYIYIYMYMNVHIYTCIYSFDKRDVSKETHDKVFHVSKEISFLSKESSSSAPLDPSLLCHVSRVSPKRCLFCQKKHLFMSPKRCLFCPKRLLLKKFLFSCATFPCLFLHMKLFGDMKHLFISPKKGLFS